LEGVPVGARDGVAHLRQRAVAVEGGGGRPAHRVDEAGVPLGVEVRPVGSGAAQVGLAAEVLGDQDAPGELGPDGLVDLAHEGPAVRQVVTPAVHAAHVRGHVVAEAVDMVVPQPHEGVLPDEGAHLGTAVVGPRLAPGGRRTAVVVEVDAALVVLGPAVEAPQVEIGGPEVVVDHVQEDRDAALVGLAHERLETVRPTVGALHREDVRGVVAP